MEKQIDFNKLINAPYHFCSNCKKLVYRKQGISITSNKVYCIPCSKLVKQIKKPVEVKNETIKDSEASKTQNGNSLPQNQEGNPGVEERSQAENYEETNRTTNGTTAVSG